MLMQELDLCALELKVELHGLLTVPAPLIRLQQPHKKTGMLCGLAGSVELLPRAAINLRVETHNKTGFV